MNIELCKKELQEKLGRKVCIIVYGMRNKVDRYEGTLFKIYPNIFTIQYEGEEKSFPYRDIITKDIKIKYL